MDILDGLNVVKPALCGSDLVPILTHLCFGKGFVFAFNHFMAIKATIPLEIECAIPGGVLLPLANSLGKSLTIDQSGESVTVKAGRSKTKLAAMHKDDFLFQFPDYSGDGSVVLTDTFVKGVSRCLISTGDDLNHPEHLGVTFCSIGGKAALYSTDNKTLSRCNTDMDYAVDGKVLLPKEFCIQLVSLYAKFKSHTEKPTLFFGDQYMIAEFGGGEVLLFSKIDTFPSIDFEKVLNNFDVSGSTYSAIPAGFKEAIDRSIIIQKSSGEQRTSISIKRRSLVVSAETGVGTVEDAMVLPTAPEASVALTVNPALVSRICNNCSELVVKENAVVFKDGDYVHLISSYNQG